MGTSAGGVTVRCGGALTTVQGGEVPNDEAVEAVAEVRRLLR